MFMVDLHYVPLIKLLFFSMISFQNFYMIYLVIFPWLLQNISDCSQGGQKIWPADRGQAGAGQLTTPQAQGKYSILYCKEAGSRDFILQLFLLSKPTFIETLRKELHAIFKVRKRCKFLVLGLKISRK
jgi:hypothetical protein